VNQNLFRVLLLCLCLAATVSAQPVITSGGVLNAASYSSQGLPNSSIAQGSYFAILGQNLGPSTPTQVSSYPLPTTQGLAGTTVQLTVGGATVNCIVAYTSAAQVNAIMPSNAPVGTGQITVTFNGQTSQPAPVTVVQSSFGAFALNSGGSGPGVVTDVKYNINSLVQDLSLRLAGPAKNGDTLTLWGTGLGPINQDETQPVTAVDLRSTVPVEVFVGGQKATVPFAGRVGNGLDQINFVIPQGVKGCFVNVAVRINGVVSNFVSIAVDPNGATACSDANGFSGADLTAAAANGSYGIGAVALTRNVITISGGGSSLTLTSDTGSGVFGSFTLPQLLFSQGISQSPSVGDCAVTTFRGPDPTPIDPILSQIKILDAGSALNVVGPSSTMPLSKGPAGAYAGTLGGVALADLLKPPPNQPKPFLNAGTFTVNGPGGSGAGAFSTQITLPGQLNWTNAGSINDITRSQNLEVDWNPSDPNGLVAIVGISSTGGDLNKTGQRVPSATTPGVAFECIAPASAGKYIVPAQVLQNLPVNPQDTVLPVAYLLVGSISTPVKFSATGIDSGYLTYRVLYGKNVNYK